MNTRLVLGSAGTAVALAAGVGIGVIVTGTSSAAPSTPGASPAPSTAATSPAAHKGGQHQRAGKDAIARLRNLEHAQWVTRSGTTNVTHDAIHGSVAAVSATSVTVKAQDGTTLSFAVGSGTKVHLRESGKGSAKAGAIGDVKTGDTVFVAGTQAGSTITAGQILDTGK